MPVRFIRSGFGHKNNNKILCKIFKTSLFIKFLQKNTDYQFLRSLPHISFERMVP